MELTTVGVAEISCIRIVSRKAASAMTIVSMPESAPLAIPVNHDVNCS